MPRTILEPPKYRALGRGSHLLIPKDWPSDWPSQVLVAEVQKLWKSSGHRCSHIPTSTLETTHPCSVRTQGRWRWLKTLFIPEFSRSGKAHKVTFHSWGFRHRILLFQIYRIVNQRRCCFLSMLRARQWPGSSILSLLIEDLLPLQRLYDDYPTQGWNGCEWPPFLINISPPDTFPPRRF